MRAHKPAAQDAEDSELDDEDPGERGALAEPAREEAGVDDACAARSTQRTQSSGSPSARTHREADADHGQPHRVRPSDGEHRWTLPLRTILTLVQDGYVSVADNGEAETANPDEGRRRAGSSRRTYCKSAPSKYPSTALDECLAASLICVRDRPKDAIRWTPPRRHACPPHLSAPRLVRGA